MIKECKGEEYFKERPEDILWYRIYRNDKFLVYKNKKSYFDEFMDVAEIPICLRLYKFFFKVGKTYINMRRSRLVKLNLIANSRKMNFII